SWRLRRLALTSPEAAEIRLPLLKEGVAALTGLLAADEGSEAVRRHLSLTEDVSGIGIEGMLEMFQRRRAQTQNLLGHGARLLHQPAGRHDTVDESPFQRLLGGILLAQEPDLPR